MRRNRNQRDAADAARIQREALERAQNGTSQANYDAVIAGFAAKGIPASEIMPRENVLTYHAWIAKGRVVRRGERGVRVPVRIAPRDQDQDQDQDQDGAKRPTRSRARAWASLFHVSQTEPLDSRVSPPAAHQGPTGLHTSAAAAAAPGIPCSRGGDSPGPHVAHKLRDLADGMQSQIDHKLDPPIGQQRPTRRRASIAASMRREGYQLQDVQRALRKMAAAIDAGDLPPSLWAVRTRQAVFDVLHSYSNPNPAGRDWLIADTAAVQQDRQRREALDAAQRDLIGSDIPGFFPTPPELAARMVSLARLDEPGLEILEPSAGKGDLADAIRAKIGDGDSELVCVEINRRLCEMLNLRGIRAHCGDILDASGEVDRVVMNPPFENGQDADHVRHCFGMLRPGGRLVAIVSAGLFHRQDRKAVEFREWLDSDEVFAVLYETLDGAFAKAFRSTGVQAVLLVLDRQLR